MNIGVLNHKVEKIIGYLDLNKHPVIRQSYNFRFTYMSFLSAALRIGARHKDQINDILSTYKNQFAIKDSDYNELLNIDFNDGEELFYIILRILGFSSSSFKSKKFKDSYCNKLLFGEMLLFDLNDSNEFNHNTIARLYADYFEISLTFEDEIKSLLNKMVSNEDVKGLLKPKEMEPIKYFHECTKAYWVQEKKNSTKVTVIATMSSGKSTLLNALLGKKVFPSENKACTSKYLKFSNKFKMSREIGIAAGKHLEIRWNFTYEDITRWNIDSDIDRIEIEGKMNSFSILKKLNISFIDTPGTNNSRDRQHEVVTQKILQQKNSDIILYVLNATNLASDDDSILLRQVVKELGNQRIIFILNKTDQLDLDADDSITDSLSIAKEYVMEHGIVSPTIIPISSYAAGLFRYILDSKPLTKREKRDALTLLELFQIPQYDMNRYIDRNLIKSLPQSTISVKTHKNIQLDDELISSRKIYEAMKKTGIHSLERLLLQISKYTP